MRKIRILASLALGLALLAAPQAGANAAPTPEARVAFAAVNGQTWGSATLYRSTKEHYLVASVRISPGKVYLQRYTAAGKKWATVGTYTTNGSTMNVKVPASKGAHTNPFHQYFRFVDAGTGKVLTKSQIVRVYKHARAQGKSWRYKSTKPVSRYNPCKTITYRIDARSARGSNSYAASRARSTMAAMGRAAGVNFKYLGSTTVTHSATTSFSPTAMITIKFGNSPHSGTAASHSKTLPGSSALRLHTSTKIVLDQGTKSTRSQAYRDAVLKHELGHALGLGHSPSKKDLMYHQLYTYNLSSNDKAGLKAVGRSGGCL